MQRKRRGVRPGWTVLPLVLLLLAGGASWVAMWERAPDLSVPDLSVSAESVPAGSDALEETAEAPAELERRRRSGRSTEPLPRDGSGPPSVVDGIAWDRETNVIGGRSAVPPAPERGVATDAEAEALRRLRADMEAAPGGNRTIGIGGRAGGRIGASQRPALLEARVVDARGGTPIEGAEVFTLFAYDDGRLQRRKGTITIADGSFQIMPMSRYSDRAEVVVRRAGYVTQRHAYGSAPKRWEMVRSDGSGRGSLRGRAHDSAGAGLAGMLLIDLRGELGDNFSAYAWSDSAGRYRVDGLHAGRWRVKSARLRGNNWVDVIVPEEGEGVADIEADRADAPPPEIPGSDRRAVLVTGPAEGSVVRAEAGVDVVWLAVVEGGAARFELPFGIWVMRRDAAGAEPEVLRVEAGAGPQDFTLSK